MSGIVGIVNLDGKPVNADLLTKMTDSLAFRGPDKTSVWINDNVGFGHTLLKTTQEHSAQPATLDGNSWLLAQARIDGRHELATKLTTRFPHAKELRPDEGIPSDNELILLSYQCWGEECLQHLIGDFAFAIWDSQKRKLFCARDQLGVAQFFYTSTNQTFIFSNTLNTLRLHPYVSSRLNEVAVGDFLLFGLNQDESTSIYSDIQRLPKAHALVETPDRMRITKYWSPEVRPVRYKTNAEYVERFKELLAVSVADRLRASDVAVSMSGGLDSTMIAAATSARLKRTYPQSHVRAYCVVYDRAFPDDEGVYAGEASRALDVPIEFLDASSINSTISPRTSGYAPEPFDVEPFYVVIDELMNRISLNSRVALTGWDGDTFMTESPKYTFHKLWRARRFVDLSRELLRYVYYHRSPPPIGVRTWWKTIRIPNDDSLYPTWIDNRFAERLNLIERWKQKKAEHSLQHETRPYAFRNLNSPHWNALFSRFDSGITRLPLEVRHPLIDLRLVNYLLNLPVIPWVIGKYIVREAMKGVLPESIRRRQKTTLAGDPGLQLRYSTKIRQADSFLPTPELSNYVRRNAVPLLTTETSSALLWINARPFSLNQWLLNSYPLDIESCAEHKNEHIHHSQNRFSGPAQKALHKARAS